MLRTRTSARKLHEGKGWKGGADQGDEGGGSAGERGRWGAEVRQVSFCMEAVEAQQPIWLGPLLTLLVVVVQGQKCREGGEADGQPAAVVFQAGDTGEEHLEGDKWAYTHMHARTHTATNSHREKTAERSREIQLAPSPPFT